MGIVLFQGVAPPRLVTSVLTHTPPFRHSCLEASSFFGLELSQVHIFSPDLTVPLLNEEGKVAMETPFKIARGPGGSGERRGLGREGDERRGREVGRGCQGSIGRRGHTRERRANHHVCRF